VIGNLNYRLGTALKDRPRVVATSDLRVRVSPSGFCTYPDLLVVCGPPTLLDSHKDTLLNPILIAEVFSLSTEAYDRGFKFAQHQTLESLLNTPWYRKPNRVSA
jgi:Uma2 family endonuclease